MAREFGILPSRVALDLETDPEQLSFVCYELLQYAKAKAAHDTCDTKTIAEYRKRAPKMMTQVEDIAHELAEEEPEEEGE